MASVILLIIGAVLAFLNSAPRLHNDDMQLMFLIYNGGVGETVPFGLYNNVVLGHIVSMLQQIIPGVNWYLAYMLLAIAVALGTINEFVFRHQGQAEEGPWANVQTLVSILLLTYINAYCLNDQQVQYTHTAILAGAAAAMIVFDALQGHAGWKRIGIGIFLFLSMYILRPEALMAFVFLAAAAAAAWFFSPRRGKAGRPALLLAGGMLAVFCVCAVAEHLEYSQNAEWNAALTCRKQRVRIQDLPDNSGMDKSGELESAGIDPEEFDVFKHFVYVPSMDNAEKIRQARDIHIRGCKGVFGLDWAAQRGLLPLTAEKLMKPFTDLVQLTPWFPFIFLLGVWVVLADKKSARVIVPALVLVAAYISVLLVAGRCNGRVQNPALFFAAAWVLAFLPADARWGKCRFIRWGAACAGLLCFLACMRHYRVRLSPKPHSAAAECQAHPENLYLAATWQAGPAYRSGLTNYTREEVKSTNVVPIADGWIFYTPAYRAFLQARGIENPYLLLPKPNTYVLIKDYDGVTQPRLFTDINTIYSKSTNGGKLEFQLRKTMGPISFWQAVER